MANLSQEKKRLLYNATLLRTGKFFQPTKSGGKIVKATKAQLEQAATILRRDGAKNAAINKQIRDFRAAKKGFNTAYFAEQARLRKRLGIPKRKDKKKDGLTGLVYLGAI